MKRTDRRAKKGETLVETIVSFAVVTLILVTITAVVRFAARVNALATERAAALENSCTAVEHGEHTGVATRSSMELTMPDGTTLSFLIDVYNTDVLTYFTQADEG